MNMKICPKCGIEIEGIFCPECGVKIDNADVIVGVSGNDFQETLRQSNESAQGPIKKKESVDYQPPYQNVVRPVVFQEKSNTNGFAIASLVLGIISIPFGVLIIPSILGIVFAVISKKGNLMCGIAKAGLVCSVIGLALAVLILLI